MMGLAQNGVIVRSGDPLAIQGMIPAGVAIQGNNVWLAAVSQNWELISSGFRNNGPTLPANTITLDTTGANLIVVVASLWAGFSFTDTMNNSWISGISRPGAGATAGNDITFSINPLTSSNHIFSFGISYYSSFYVFAFKSPSTIIAGPSSGIQSLLTPPISVPANSLIVANMTNNAIADNGSTFIDGGFNLSFTGQYGATAYKIQLSAGVVQPIWTATPSGSSSVMLSFILSP